MKRVVEEMAVILATFKEKPVKIIGQMESLGAYVFGRYDGAKYLLLIACEPLAVNLVIDMITPIKDNTWEPFSVEIRGMFDSTPEPKEAEVWV